jgi:hypothetical protein
MKTLLFAGALMFSFALGGITTLLGFPRHLPAATTHSALTISPDDLTRSAGPLPEQVVDNYF